MKENYQYILEKCEELVGDQGRVLDYGCGKGVVVEAGLQKGIEFYGVEAFSHGSGSNIKSYLRERNLLDNKIREINISDNIIDFPDKYFDLVVSNQVFEHVVNIEIVLSEISRVLKDDGKLLLIFPLKETWREGHCGILFAHLLPKSKFRYYWLLLFKSLDFGRLKKRRTNKQWAAFFNDWLEDSVVYRSLDDIHTSIKKYYSAIDHIEEDYLSFRLRIKKHLLLSKVCRLYPLSSVSRYFVKKWGGTVLVAKK